MQAEEHFFHAEGLGDVIVAAGSQAEDAVLDGVFRRQEQRGYLRREGADPREQLNAVEPGEHYVQHQDIRAELLGELHGLGAVACDGNGPPCHPQAHAHELGEAGFVVNHQGADGGAVGMGELGKVVGHGVRSGHGATLRSPG
ncbi:hypothetical protein J2805_001973 [Arthrobacter oryzae]|nr:hypothetical protein [Arthrobacter oryzae]